MERDQGDQVVNAQVIDGTEVCEGVSGEGSQDGNPSESSARPGPKGDRIESARIRDQIVELAVSGHPNAEIAEQMNVSERWVRVVLRDIRRRAQRMAEERTLFRLRQHQAGLN